MARKTLDVTIEAEGRDKGKTFHITEMPAAQAEKWAMRAILTASKSGVDIGNAASMGMQGIAVLGIQALLSAPWEDVEPLVDEMMLCVQTKEASGVRPVMGDDIEEVATRIQLRQAILELHIGFSAADKK